jgi:competence protein ComEC
VDTLRARIALRIAEHVADPEAAALITALAVGITGGMSTDQWRVFNATGTTHLVAISGLHVTLFATLMFFLARLLWRYLPCAQRAPREPFALLLGILAAGGYTLLAGFSVPTQRTWLMLTIFALTRLAARHAGAGHTWSLAMVGVLLLDVFAPLQSGFWLSFIAVGVILMFATTALLPQRPVRQLLGLQLAVTVALAPLTFAVFGGLSLVGLAVNLLAIPVISFVFVPLVLAGALAGLMFPMACAPLFALAATLHQWLWPALVWAADLDVAVWRFQPPAWWFALALPAGLLLLLCWPRALRVAGLCLLLPLLFAPSRLPAHGNARVLVLDAGRSSAALVVTQAHVLLFDTGDAWNTRGSRVARLVIPALDAFAVRRIDQLVLPRLDADRAQGAALLAHEREVSDIVVGGGWAGTSLPARACRDERHSRDGVEIELFAAGAGGCVLRVSVAGHAMFFAGDLDMAAEQNLLARFPPAALSSQVVLMSRGASARASGRKWIEASGARLAIAAGGHGGAASRAQALARWQAADVPVLDVLHEGGIEIGLGMQGFAVLSTARAARYPFAWRR